MSTTYPYSLAVDFGGAINEAKLRDAINADVNIVPHCSDVGLAGDSVNVTFLGDLSPGEQTELTSVVIPAHDASPSPNDTQIVSVTNAPSVRMRKPDGGRAYIFGVDFCDKRTWFTVAVPQTGEAVGTGNGVSTTFQLAHGSGAVAGEVLLDLTRGRVTDDHLMAPPGGLPGGYAPVVRINGVEQTMREPYEAGGGDYDIDFTTGLVTFFNAPGDTLAVTASYYYVPANVGPILKAGPPPGKKWTIDKAEAQISADLANDDWFTDTIIMNVFYAPYDMADPANEVRYYTFGNLLDYAAGSFVSYPPSFGPRGINKPSHIFRWDYLTPIILTHGFELRAWTKHGRPLGAARATVVMYALEEDA